MRMTRCRKNAMRSQSRSASSRLCVHRNTVRPSPRSATMNSRTVFAAEPESSDLGGPGGRRDERAEEAQGGRFARAIGAEEAEDLALVHVEIDAVHRGEVAESLGQLLGADDGLHRIRSLFLEFTDDRV